jgi:hypothetical protein
VRSNKKIILRRRFNGFDSRCPLPVDARKKTISRQIRDNFSSVYCTDLDVLALNHLIERRNIARNEGRAGLAEKRGAASTSAPEPPEAAILDERKEYYRNESEHFRRSRDGIKGVLTKVKRRVGKGTCPCCKRHFVNVERHMKVKHPSFADAPVE